VSEPVTTRVLRSRALTSLYAGVLFTLLGLAAWASGQPAIFPSLGPTAFVLANEYRGGRVRGRRVVGGHVIGGVVGLAAYTAVASGLSVTAVPPALSADGLRLAASATLSVVLTSWGMIATDTVHPPACATTLIVSLGLLSTPRRVGIIVVSVVALVAVHLGARRLLAAVTGAEWPLDPEEEG